MATDCLHQDHTPVESLISLEVVAQICLTCHDQLPANWGCWQCEWDEIHELGGRIDFFCTQRCKDHWTP